MTQSSHYHITSDTIEAERLIIEESKKDPGAFRFIYESYHEAIFRYVYQRCDDKAAAFDITQQVFVKALIHLPAYTFRGVPFSSWLYRIAKSEVFQAIKDNKVSRTLNVDFSGLKDMLQEAEVDDSFLQKEKSLTICMGGLPESDMHLVEMRFFESRAFREIGEILKVTENNAKVKLYRVLDKLKKCILSNR